jgi:cytochrome c biogenesis protein CcmG/thiol:disulfide interchange protein DsbE
LNRFVVPLIAFALLVVVLAIGVRRAPEKSTIESVLIGRPAPSFDLPRLGNEPGLFRSADWRGRAFLLNVWGTWCVECRAEHDVLLAIKRSGVVPLIGLNWKDDDALALRWLEELGNPYDAVAADREGRVAIDWGVYGAPETFLVDARGIVVHKHVGPLSEQIWARDFLPQLQPVAAQSTNRSGP